MNLVDQHIIRRAPNFMQADVYHAFGETGDEYVIKDASKRPAIARTLYIRRALRHESETLTRLDNVPGIPQNRGFDGPDRLIITYLQHQKTLPGNRDHQRSEFPPPAFFDTFEEIVRRMHERGVAHGDIRRRNILVDGDTPCLIDFATAVIRDARPRWFHRRLFNFVKRVDTIKVVKLKQAYYPEHVTENEKTLLEDKPWLLRAGEFYRKRIYRSLFKQKRWKERWQRLKARLGAGSPLP